MFIDVYSDPVCPWCFIGHQRLATALGMAGLCDGKDGLAVRWQVFQLNPTMAAGGMDRKAYLSAKFGSPVRAQSVYGTIHSEGIREGIAFAFDRIKRTPNTLDAHRLMRLASRSGRGSSVAEGLFSAYFLEGRDIGDHGVLSDIGQTCGIELIDTAPEILSVADYLASSEDADDVRREDAAARTRGISGVPFYVFDERLSISGAQSPEVLARAIELANQYS